MSSLPRSSVSTALVLFVVVFVAAAGIAFPPTGPPGVSAQEETPTPTPTPEPPGQATFNESVYEVTAGETLEIVVNLTDVEEAMIVVGDETTDYRANATVTDGNGDGMVTLLFDTGAAGTEDPTFDVADDEDEVELVNETELDDGLTFSNIPMAATVEGIETDSATILVREAVDREETPTETPTPSPEQTPTETPADEGTQGDETPGDGEDGTEDTPGFGLVAALLAVLLAALLAVRRE